MLEKIKGPLYFTTLVMALSVLWATAKMRSLESVVDRGWMPAVPVAGFDPSLWENPNSDADDSPINVEVCPFGASSN